jgi:glycosyltransferase
MKVSIITVVFNNIQTILDCIDSVYGQSHRNIEHIIIDGNSTDGTLELIYENIYKVGVLRSEDDNGIYDAMNKGISFATGEIVGILNSDDIYFNCNSISEVVGEFLTDPDLDILYGDIVYVMRNNTESVVRKWKSRTYYENYFEDGHVPPHPSLFIKNSVYHKVESFNLDFGLAADYEFMLRIFKMYDFKSKYISKVIVKMRLGGATNRNLSNIKLQNIEVLRAWKINNLNVPLLLMPKRLVKRLRQFFW